jgi:hypothetical protein
MGGMAQVIPDELPRPFQMITIFPLAVYDELVKVFLDKTEEIYYKSTSFGEESLQEGER